MVIVLPTVDGGQQAPSQENRLEYLCKKEGPPKKSALVSMYTTCRIFSVVYHAIRQPFLTRNWSLYISICLFKAIGLL